MSPPRRAVGLAVLGTLALAAPLLAQRTPQEPRDDATMPVEHDADAAVAASEILASWGRRFDALVVQDHAIERVEVHLQTPVDAELTWGAIKGILDAYDVVVVESRPSPDGPWVIRAHHRRNLTGRCTPPWQGGYERCTPKYDGTVAGIFEVEHGAANSIFATIGGGRRDHGDRVENVLYVEGPEVIIVLGQRSEVRYYGRVVEALDEAGPREGVRTYRIQHAPVREVANSVAATLRAPDDGRTREPHDGAPDGDPDRTGRARVVAHPLADTLLVVGSPADLEVAEELVDTLDVAGGPPEEQPGAADAGGSAGPSVSAEHSDRASADGRGRGRFREPRHDATLHLEHPPDAPIEATELLADWGRRFGAFVVVDAAVRSVRVRFRTGVDAELTWGAVKAILDVHDVVVDEHEPTPDTGAWVIGAHHRCVRPTGVCPCDPAEEHADIVTSVFRVEHGTAHSIFAAIQGFGPGWPPVANVLYLPGPEVIVVVEPPARVRYYGRLIDALDVPGPRRTLRRYAVEHAPPQEVADHVATVLWAAGHARAEVVARPATERGPGPGIVVVASAEVDGRLLEEAIEAGDAPELPPCGRAERRPPSTGPPEGR